MFYHLALQLCSLCIYRFIDFQIYNSTQVIYFNKYFEKFYTGSSPLRHDVLSFPGLILAFKIHNGHHLNNGKSL